LVGSYPDHPQYHFFDRELEADLKQTIKKQPAGFSFQSMDYQERKLTFTVYTDKGLDYLMSDRNIHQKTSLGQHWIKTLCPWFSWFTAALGRGITGD